MIVKKAKSSPSLFLSGVDCTLVLFLGRFVDIRQLDTGAVQQAHWGPAFVGRNTSTRKRVSKIAANQRDSNASRSEEAETSERLERTT